MIFIMKDLNHQQWASEIKLYVFGTQQRQTIRNGKHSWAWITFVTFGTNIFANARQNLSLVGWGCTFFLSLLLFYAFSNLLLYLLALGTWESKTKMSSCVLGAHAWKS